MVRHLASFLILLIKLFVDRRPYRAAHDFKFRWRLGTRKFHRIYIAARQGPFRARLFMRKGSTDLGTFEQVFGNSDYNLRRLKRWDEVWDLYRSLSMEGIPLILDLGANVGMSALYFANLFPEAQILAVEPEHGNFQTLMLNAKGHDNIQPIQAAVASADGKVKIVNPSAEEWAFRTEQTDEEGGSIAATSIPSLIAMADARPRPRRNFVVKIDIEGFEANLFSENTQWVETFPIIIIELHDWMLPRSSSSRFFIQTIAGGKWDVVQQGENLVCLSNTVATGASV